MTMFDDLLLMGAERVWFESVADSDLHISALSLGEIQAGIELTRDQDAVKAAEIEQWANLVAASYNVLPMDAATFRSWAKLMHRRSDTLYEDAMIAATAIRHQLKVVTRNVADFSDFGVKRHIGYFRLPKGRLCHIFFKVKVAIPGLA